ncbi:PIN domain-containing protein [Candidatus Micrarchaeota archaeon]|nr:PIN domain-containing protein [Candidatus Micrarchaeota archaeon]
MKAVIDANIFFAAFLRKNSDVRKIIISPHVELYSPDWLLKEFEKHQSELLEKMDDENAFLETKELLLSFVKITPKELYEECLEKAQRELKNNKKDVPYIALCLFLDAPLWSNDTALKKSQKLVKVLTVPEMIHLIAKP